MKKIRGTKRNICNYHDDIIRCADEIISCVEYVQRHNYVDEKLDLNDIVQFANQILDYAEGAKLAGLAMEARLARYKQGIEEMGFIRNKE